LPAAWRRVEGVRRLHRGLPLQQQPREAVHVPGQRVALWGTGEAVGGVSAPPEERRVVFARAVQGKAEARVERAKGKLPT
jgi:hypothetical protein